MRSVSIARQKVILFRERRIYIYKYRVLIKRCMRSILAFNDASEFGGFREVNEGGRRYRVSRHVSRGQRGIHEEIYKTESRIFFCWPRLNLDRSGIFTSLFPREPLLFSRCNNKRRKYFFIHQRKRKIRGPRSSRFREIFLFRHLVATAIVAQKCKKRVCELTRY